MAQLSEIPPTHRSVTELKKSWTWIGDAQLVENRDLWIEDQLENASDPRSLYHAMATLYSLEWYKLSGEALLKNQLLLEQSTQYQYRLELAKLAYIDLNRFEEKNQADLKKFYTEQIKQLHEGSKLPEATQIWGIIEILENGSTNAEAKKAAETALHNPNVSIRIKAVEAFSKLVQNTEDRQRVLSLLRDQSGAVVDAVVLATQSEFEVKGEDLELLSEIFLDLSIPARHLESIYNISKHLDFETAVIELSKSKDIERLANAARFLGNYDSLQSNRALIRLAHHKDYTIRNGARSSFGERTFDNSTLQVAIGYTESAWVPSILRNARDKIAAFKALEVYSNSTIEGILLSTVESLAYFLHDQAAIVLLRLSHYPRYGVYSKAQESFSKQTFSDAVVKVATTYKNSAWLARQLKRNTSLASSKLLFRIAADDNYPIYTAAQESFDKREMVDELVQEARKYPDREWFAIQLGRAKNQKLALDALELFMSSTNKFARRGAAIGIGEFLSDRAAKYLFTLGNDNDYQVYSIAQENFAKQSFTDPVVVHAASFDNSIWMARELSRTKTIAASKLLFRLAAENRYNVYNVAQESFGQREVVDALVIEAKKYPNTGWIAEQLGRASNQALALDSLILFVESKDSFARLGAAKSLGKIISDRAAMLLLALAYDDVYNVYSVAHESFSKQKLTDPVIMEAAKYENSVWLARELSRSTSLASSKLLFRLASDPKYNIYDRARESFGNREIPDQLVVEAQKYADNGWIALQLSRSTNQKLAVDTIALFAKSQNLYARRDAAKALGSFPTDESRRLLKILKEDPNFQVRDAAKKSLEAIGGLEANRS